MLFLDSSMAEHTAVNRGVVGSSPTRGVFGKSQKIATSPKGTKLPKRQTVVIKKNMAT